MSDEEIYRRIENAIGDLGEFADAVQILVSWQDDDRNTCNVYLGSGNWFARRGMAQDFIEKDQAETTAGKIADSIPQPPHDDGEEWKDED